MRPKRSVARQAARNFHSRSLSVLKRRHHFGTHAIRLHTICGAAIGAIGVGACISRISVTHGGQIGCTHDTGLVETTGTTCDVHPIDEVTKALTRSVGATHLVWPPSNTGRFPDVRGRSLIHSRGVVEGIHRNRTIELRR